MTAQDRQTILKFSQKTSNQQTTVCSHFNN